MTRGRGPESHTTGEVPHPLVILTPPRSHSSIVGTMIGCHPQLYGLPELQLWEAETIAEWLLRCANRYAGITDGILRAVAELLFGSQTERTIELARGWIRRRAACTVGMILEELARMTFPRILTDKSPATVWDLGSMQRVLDMFPDAHFIHLVRHPRGQGESVVKYLADLGGPGQAPRWLHELVAFEPVDHNVGPPPSGVDPQHAWYALNRKILTFLKQVPVERQLRVRSEDVLMDPDIELKRIGAWLGLRSDDEALDAMKSPERSPYACFGPANAPFGNDINFLQDPTFRPMPQPITHSLDGPLPWRGDDVGFARHVIDQATIFGYT